MTTLLGSGWRNLDAKALNSSVNQGLARLSFLAPRRGIERR